MNTTSERQRSVEPGGQKTCSLTAKRGGYPLLSEHSWLYREEREPRLWYKGRRQNAVFDNEERVFEGRKGKEARAVSGDSA